MINIYFLKKNINHIIYWGTSEKKNIMIKNKNKQDNSKFGERIYYT